MRFLPALSVDCLLVFIGRREKLLALEKVTVLGVASHLHKLWARSPYFFNCSGSCVDSFLFLFGFGIILLVGYLQAWSMNMGHQQDDDIGWQ